MKTTEEIVSILLDRQMGEPYIIDFYPPLLSNRKVVGGFIVFFKETLRRALKYLFLPVVNKQNIINMQMAAELEANKRELESVKMSLVDVRRQISEHDNNENKRKKITITSTFDIYPPTGGAKSRIFNLYGKLAKKYDIEAVSFTANGNDEFIGTIAPGFVESRVPMSDNHLYEQQQKYDKEIGIKTEDITMFYLSEKTPRYGELLKKSLDDSEFAVLSHPYLYHEVKKHSEGIKLAYEAHNVEYLLKKNVLPDNESSREILKLLFDIEKECCHKSEFVFTCSDEDKDSLCELYDVPPDKVIIVPNGVDCSQTAFTDFRKRRENKTKLDLGNETLALFIGSYHEPNIEACEHIFKIAEKCPDVRFLLMGSQCFGIAGMAKEMPKNVGLLGLVSEEEKARIYSVVDFALNPITSGSGTNLKMFDYMSAGIPIITTEFGARGIERRDVFIVSEIDDMAATIEKYKSYDFTDKTLDARNYAESTFDWGVISEVLLKKLESVFSVEGES